jgi:hypothetical protein
VTIYEKAIKRLNELGMAWKEYRKLLKMMTSFDF